MGIPEVNLGLIPSGGATIRLMWLLGIEKAFQILTEGRHYSAREALKVGIIDEIAQDEKEMMEKAKQFILENEEGRRPWDRENEKIPGGSAKRNDIAKKIRLLSAKLISETSNNYPAKQAILEILSEGSKVDFDTACRTESRYYTSVVLSAEFKNMIKCFWFDYNFVKRGDNRPKGFGRFRPKRVGIIGAGVMGSGIAFACVKFGMEVILKDISLPVAERGREYVKIKLDEAVKMGSIGEKERNRMIKKIKTTQVSSDFETCDIVIEAVFENIKVKQKVNREAEEFLDEYSVYASNTVSIPITSLAKASIRPENFVGLHFFHPADQVPLVEIIKGKSTSDETLARAFDFVNSIKKVPIIVKDVWGFYAARVKNTYILEGVSLLIEGYPAALIENLGKQVGMPKGPLEFADDLGLSLVLKYEDQASQHYGKKYIQHPSVQILKRMIDDFNRPGKPKKGGFYDYSTHDGNKKLWVDLDAHFTKEDLEFNLKEIKERLLFVQVIEAAWCMHEKVIKSVPAANLGSVFGWGFPKFKGGVIQFVKDYGYLDFKKRCKTYEEKYGQRFKVPNILENLVED